MMMARLAHAVRQQDWFVVALEVAIVVLGVVIGFQVTAWGQARADRAREATYLVQLAEDARETIRRIDESNSATLTPVVRKNAQLLRAFRLPEPPPRDSILTWLTSSFVPTVPSPVTATAEALARSGDLALIRNDSLRRALPAYIERSASRTADVRLAVAGSHEAYRDGSRYIDWWEAPAGLWPQSRIDSLADGDMSALPAGPRKTPFPLVVEEMLQDRDLYNRFYVAHTMARFTRSTLLDSRDDAATMLRLVESAQLEASR